MLAEAAETWGEPAVEADDMGLGCVGVGVAVRVWRAPVGDEEREPGVDMDYDVVERARGEAQTESLYQHTRKFSGTDSRGVWTREYDARSETTHNVDHLRERTRNVEGERPGTTSEGQSRAGLITC